jgi:hypothetical protein
MRDLHRSVTVLLNGWLDDVDDEVRDHATFYLKTFDKKPLVDAQQANQKNSIQLEEVELNASDYIIPSYANFGAEWDWLRTSASVAETFALSAMESSVN